jgi:methyl-accepting chemotaxis protein
MSNDSMASQDLLMPDYPMTDGSWLGDGFVGAAQRIYPAWQERLSQLSARLREISGSSESEFLAIGAKLTDFYGRAGAVNDMANEVLQVVMGNDTADAVGSLREILARLDGYLSRAEREAAASTGTFATIINLLGTARSPLDGFKKINKVLRMLGTSTKIESARLGSSAVGFDTLANDVAKLSVQVIDKSDIIQRQITELETLIRNTLRRAEDIEAEQHQQARTMLDETNGSLTILTEVNSRCSSAVGGIVQVAAAVSANLSEVVMSMQFHDIVRQQIEHVDEALIALLALVGPAAGSDERVQRAMVIEVGDVCQVQAAQLHHSREELETAANRIVTSLQAIARQEGGLSHDSRNMAGVADTTGSSFFNQMEHDMSTVATVLAENAAENHELAMAMTRVASTVSQIVGFVGDIENIGEEIELIALNSQIKAARTGADGAALGVLAEAIQRLSIDTMLQTEAVAETLRNVTTVTESLCTGADADAAELNQEIQGVTEEITLLLQGVRQVNERLQLLLGQMEGMVGALSTDIEMTVGGLSSHLSVSAVLTDAAAMLNGIAGEARQLVPAAARTAESGILSTLSERYTMHSERKVHATITGQTIGTKSESRVGVPAAPVDESGLGDNVELF